MLRATLTPHCVASMTLMTIGYEGADIHTFTTVLKVNNVTTLIDVRELPLSRKKNFSKSALAAAMEGSRISYLHLRALGCPREIRNDYHADGNWRLYSKRFNAYLGTQVDALDELQSICRLQNCCLVCFEADYRRCHRSLVTAALTRTCHVKVEHLTVRRPDPVEGPGLAVA
jgi:uncharacterized protein (DUF488 family)